jgi:hypothetical protein
MLRGRMIIILETFARGVRPTSANAADLIDSS